MDDNKALSYYMHQHIVRISRPKDRGQDLFSLFLFWLTLIDPSIDDEKSRPRRLEIKFPLLAGWVQVDSESALLLEWRQAKGERSILCLSG